MMCKDRLSHKRYSRRRTYLIQKRSILGYRWWTSLVVRLFPPIRRFERMNLQIGVLFSALTLIQPNREGLEVVAAGVAVVPRTKGVVAGVVVAGIVVAGIVVREGVMKLILQRDVAYCEETVPAFKASVARCIGKLHY